MISLTLIGVKVRISHRMKQMIVLSKLYLVLVVNANIDFGYVFVVVCIVATSF